MNKIIRVLLSVLFMCGLSDSIAQTSDGPSDKPNVLFISVDDLNNWIGVPNNFSHTKTPNIDKLAAKGVLFSNAHSQAPLCGPSRASIMTGLRPSTTGIYGMISDEKIRSENPTTSEIIFLPEYFKEQGYHTMGIGKLFHDHAPRASLWNLAVGKKDSVPCQISASSGTVMELQIAKTMDVPVPIGELFLNTIP